MGSIYGNAYITFAAGASSDDDGGFFKQTTLAYTNPHNFKLTVDGTDHEIYVRHETTHPDSLRPAKGVLPLMKRGWTLQERLLSRRFLCFSQHEILWECLEDVSCTCSVTEGPFNPRLGQYPSFLHSSATKHQYANLDNLTSPEASRTWRHLVTEYSSRELSIKSDKLPALNGIAARYQVCPPTYPHSNAGID
jgi:hypothetical protein